MALQKQSIPLNFSQGLDTKTDPNQVQVGKYLALNNSVFDTGGRLTKRNGFPLLTRLPDTNETILTTLSDNLIATGSNLYSYASELDTWFNKGIVQPIQLSTLPAVRQSTSQTSPDIAIDSKGLACIVYNDSTYGGSYVILDTVSGEQVINQTALPNTASQARAFLLGNYFVITFIGVISSTPELQYVAVPINNVGNPSAFGTISANVLSTTAGYDGVVANNLLFISWAESGTVIGTNVMTPGLVLQTTTTTSGHAAHLMSASADTTTSPNPTIYFSYWESSSSNGYVISFTYLFDGSSTVTLIPGLTNTEFVSGATLATMTSYAEDGVLSVFYEVKNAYASPYPVSNTFTDFIDSVTVTSTGTVGSASTISRSVGLASKAFKAGPTVYMLVAYGDTNTNQPSYFLIDSLGNLYMRLAYSNGGGYSASQILTNVVDLDDTFSLAYLFKDFLTTVNKGTDNPTGTPANAIFTQTGVNVASFTINPSIQYSSEIAGSLQLTGGQLWQYDGSKPVEFGFNIWPENVQVTTATSGGSIDAGTYYYQFTYEWTDNQGQLHRSAPSIPFVITTTGSASENTIYVPTLRLTYKEGTNPVRIVGYRWSVAQEVYYQFTSVTVPTLNDKTVDFVTITDQLSDAEILGNAIIYTTGGVIEDIAPPASIASALFKNRLILVDAEDQNLLWYSKQVIENVPVEMSDLFTIYVAPTTGAQGSTGPITALSAMDDKLIIFKKDAIYYITGSGPDNTGSNNDFSDPIYISSSVGTNNPNSIVLTPNGIMFQSDKGIWLLGRDLTTNYIGAPVEQYNAEIVVSALVIPGTNQVRFILNNGIMLMFDYYYQQWGTFTSLSPISAVLYQGVHTYLNKYGQIFQEKAGTYLDGSNPVLMSYTTSWLNIAGIRGYERFYFLFMLGTYFTPFKLNMLLSYDYNPSPQQNIVITPDNYSPAWGGEANWGAGKAWGGPGNTFQARVFPQIQKCQTFQIRVEEVYDSSFGVPAGQGLTLSGMNVVVGVKKGYSIQKASRSFG